MSASDVHGGRGEGDNLHREIRLCLRLPLRVLPDVPLVLLPEAMGFACGRLSGEG